MASDYDWSLPSFDSDSSGGGYDLTSSGNESWTSSGGYDLGSSGESFNFNDDDWYVDSTGGSVDVDTSIFDDIWGWVKSDQGVSVLGGAANAAFKLWQADKANEMRRQNAAAGGPSAAELYDARVKRHNASINQPMDMGLVELKRS